MVKKTTIAKKTTTRSAAKAPVEDVDTAVEEVAVADDTPEAELVKSMGKRELIDRVVEASGIKKKAAKPVIEAMLKELGDALSRGETLNLQPFGKGIVKSHKNLENAEIVELRLRRSKIAVNAATLAADALAEEREQDNDSDDSTPVVEAAE